MGEPVLSRDGTGTVSIQLAPNRSLSSRSYFLVLLTLGAGAGGISMLLWYAGAWPVIPFFVLEMVVLCLLLCLNRRRLRDCETIVLNDRELRIVKYRGNRQAEHRFPRYWARALVEPVRGGWYPSRLLIRSHGRDVEIGACMREEERLALAAKLRRLLATERAAHTQLKAPVEPALSQGE